MSTKIKFDEAVLKSMVELEGLTYEEAKLTYEQRENLPASAFCGPNRTYPAHDERHIRNAIVRLMTFKPSGWQAILRCVCRRATKAKIDSAICQKYGFQSKPKSEESKSLVDWYKGIVKSQVECAECK